MSATPTRMPILVEFGCLGNSPQIREKTSLWLFVVSLFSCSRLEQKPVNGFARSMAQTREIRQGCAFWGIRQKIFTPTPNINQIPKMLHYWSSFSRKTRINLGGSSTKIAYSNKKQPMAISNFRLKIWPDAVFWPFLRVRSRKLAKNTWNRGLISKISRHIGNRARISQIWGHVNS